ncbi:hypothetical protein ACP0FP_25845, partial [Escherichia coli]|uniref:hypothetical protein n=1 Tax=Escherichia coli TaxID=562 RepID=UPI003CEC8F68
MLELTREGIRKKLIATLPRAVCKENFKRIPIIGNIEVCGSICRFAGLYIFRKIIPRIQIRFYIVGIIKLEH